DTCPAGDVGRAPGRRVAAAAAALGEYACGREGLRTEASLVCESGAGAECCGMDPLQGLCVCVCVCERERERDLEKIQGLFTRPPVQWWTVLLGGARQTRLTQDRVTTSCESTASSGFAFACANGVNSAPHRRCCRSAALVSRRHPHP
uniref:Uncharacterized protein n=1 Tax=Scleropages formosus TaxID=113540 RepID=A0A8C9SC43_SCLFO